MNLPRDTVGMGKEDAIFLRGCHGNATALAGGRKEMQHDAVTQETSVMHQELCCVGPGNAPSSSGLPGHVCLLPSGSPG